MTVSIDEIAHLIGDRTFDNILAVHRIDITDALPDCRINIYQIVHNTIGSRIACEEFGDEVLILDNSYMTSFLDNIALAALTTTLDDCNLGTTAAEIVFGIVKKFFSEQMLAIGNSHMARTLFLETLMEYDQHLQVLFELKKSHERLARSSHFFTACVADFLRGHEIGHLVVRREKFSDYRLRAHQEALRISHYENLSFDDQTRLQEEIASDLFAINNLFVIYSGRMSGERLKNYTSFLVNTLIRMHVIHELAGEAHRLNNDENFDTDGMELRFAEWQIRENIMLNYIEELEFGDGTVRPVAEDTLLPIDVQESGIFDVTTGRLNEMPAANYRRLAQLISSGFASTAGFDAVVSGTRMTRQLDRPE